MKASLSINEQQLTQNGTYECVRTLGAHTGPSISWNMQFNVIKEKMREAIGNLKL